jgi:hypothetical protein
MEVATFQVEAEKFTEDAKAIVAALRSECKSLRSMATQRGAKVVKSE